MSKTVKMYNGEIRNFVNEEGWQKLQEENWQMINKEQKAKEEKLKQIIDKIEKYVKQLKGTEKYKYSKIGLVYTKLKEDITDKNMFLIWVDKGRNIQHKYININDI